MRKNSGVLCNAAVPGKYGKGWHRFCRHSSRRGPRESCLACGGFPGISHFRVVYADMLCHYYCCRTRDAAVLAGSAANRSKLISSNPACTPGSTCERVLFSLPFPVTLPQPRSGFSRRLCSAKVSRIYSADSELGLFRSIVLNRENRKEREDGQIIKSDLLSL